MFADDYAKHYSSGLGGAVRPWDSPDSVEEHHEIGGARGNLAHIKVRTYVAKDDSQEQIDYCLTSCPYTECRNCVVNVKRRVANPQKKGRKAANAVL